MTFSLIHTPLMSERTTLRLGGPALAEAVARQEADLEQLARELERLGGRAMALGAGSNLLAAGGEADMVFVRAANVEAPQLVRQPDGAVLVRAAAGIGLPRLLGFCRQLGLSGLEPLTGIPGKVGGAVAMNAGSYGLETGSRLSRVRLWTSGLGLVWRMAEDCAFGYRRFDPGLDGLLGDGLYLVWEAEFVLTPDDPAAVHARMVEVYAKKKAAQPVTAKSAGCVFKNPAGLSAGLLLDQAGMRGKTLGGMAFSPVHANFLVNLGNGAPAQALELMELGREAVRKNAGIELETEVVVLR
jgi:UDP-N-acetylmuramate dehydrogenase